MTDAVNVPREVLERIEAHCKRLETDGSYTVMHGTPSAPTGNSYYNYDLARDLRTLLADAPKAEPLSNAQQLDLSDVRSKLSEIVDCSRALRQGGPAPEDLDELSNALDRATGLADDILADVVWADPSIPASQPEAPKVEREPCAKCRGLGYLTWEGGDSTESVTEYEDCPSCIHPAPASDELLSIVKELRDAGNGLFVLKNNRGDYGYFDDLADRIERIAKHKGAQS